MDVTSRRNTVEAMNLCDQALASTSEAIVITDPSLPDNPIIYCNQGFETLTGPAFVSRGSTSAFTATHGAFQLGSALKAL